ncbi:MAG: alpha/beta hydrolase family protein [Cellvibrionaceae bacterium]|nr:alpha/beta hydrolase family protein [Cellvibrionaceae bacterium]
MKSSLGLLLLICLLKLPANTVWAQEETHTGETTAAQTDNTRDASAPQRPPAAARRPSIPGSHYETMKLLAADLAEETFVWLKNGETAYLAVWQPDRSGSPKGALLILHAEGETPMWPQLSKPLHNTLPDYGWATLAISLPLPDPPAIPTRTLPAKTRPTGIEQPTKQTTAETSPAENRPAEAASQSQAKTPSIMAEADTEQRLTEALRFLHDQGQFNVIILGSGVGAIRAQYFIDKITPKVTNPRLKATLEKPIRALVLVNARNQLHAGAEVFKDWFSDPEIPVLDIFLTTDKRNSQAAKQRQILARQKNIGVYKQVRIAALSREKSWEENRLSRRIRSFLDNNAVGIEVDNATVRRYK